MKAWHFVGDTLRDGSSIPEDGKWLVYSGPLVLCESGLHASREPFDALQYAPGNTLCYVEIAGEMIQQKDKIVCRKRKIIRRMNAEEMLRYFARMQALSCIHLWDAPDMVLDYLMSGDESMWDDAWAATWAVAGAAARKEFNELVYESFGIKS